MAAATHSLLLSLLIILSLIAAAIFIGVKAQMLPQGGAAIPPQVLTGGGLPPGGQQPLGGAGQRDIRPQDSANVFTGTGNSLYFGGAYLII